jgi:hypothetical protein
VQPLQASTADVLKFLGAHAWKWRYRAPAPYREITVRLVHFIRSPSGKFERNQFSAGSSAFIEPRTSDEILVVCGSKNGHATFVVSFGRGTSGPHERASISFADYSRSGSGDGGLPQIIDLEYTKSSLAMEGIIEPILGVLQDALDKKPKKRGSKHK